MDERTYKELEAEASKLGKEAGLAAASWFFDGNTAESYYRFVLVGMDDGIPEVMDMLPGGWLSGEFADTPTPNSLMRDLGVEPYTDEYDASVDALCQAYEQAADDASYEEIERVARYQTSS